MPNRHPHTFRSGAAVRLRMPYVHQAGELGPFLSIGIADHNTLAVVSAGLQ